MRSLLSTISGRLTLGFIAIITVLGAIYVGAAMISASYLVRQVDQELNRHLASGLVRGYGVFEGGQLQDAEVRALFRNLMVVNPNIEMYMIDLDGRIIAYDAPDEIVRLEHVDMAPVRHFINPTTRGTVLGDDPRNPGVYKPITVATVLDGATVSGYLYIVIGGQAFDNVFRVLRDSYALKLAGFVAIVGTILSVLAALVLFSFVTKRVRNLSTAVDDFVTSEFKGKLTPAGRMALGDDEITRLEQNIHAMANRISQQLEQLETADNTRRDMIANISHDLRTPIAAIHGYAETVLLNSTEISDETRQHMESAQANICRLSSLIDQLFELSRLDDPSLRLETEIFSIAELLHDVVQKHQITAQQKAIELTVSAPPSPPTINGDIGLIERLLDNLIGNAIKFVPQQGHIDVSLISETGGFCIRVADDGPGISIEDQAQIFRRHFRKRTKTNGNAHGAGLGLSIAKRVAELHGGHITLRSELGSGASFDVHLPG